MESRRRAGMGLGTLKGGDEMIEEIATTLNWLAITVPFFVAAGIFQALKQIKAPGALALLGAAVTIAAIWFGYFHLYDLIGFPAWMGWIHKLMQ